MSEYYKEGEKLYDSVNHEYVIARKYSKTSILLQSTKNKEYERILHPRLIEGLYRKKFSFQKNDIVAECSSFYRSIYFSPIHLVVEIKKYPNPESDPVSLDCILLNLTTAHLISFPLTWVNINMKPLEDAYKFYEAAATGNW